MISLIMNGCSNRQLRYGVHVLQMSRSKSRSLSFLFKRKLNTTSILSSSSLSLHYHQHYHEHYHQHYHQHHRGHDVIASMPFSASSLSLRRRSRWMATASTTTNTNTTTNTSSFMEKEKNTPMTNTTADSTTFNNDEPPKSQQITPKISPSSSSSSSSSLVSNAAPMDKRKLFRYLKLETFSIPELESVFDRIVANHDNHNTEDQDNNNNNNNNNHTTSNSLTTKMVQDFIDMRVHEMEVQQPQKSSNAATNLNTTTTTTIPAAIMSSSSSSSSSSSTISPILLPPRTPEMEILRQEYIQEQTQQFIKVFSSSSSNTSTTTTTTTPPQTLSTSSSFDCTKHHFTTTLTSLAEQVDYNKTMPITISMLLVGTSVGIITPVMPFVVEAMGLTAGQYGLVVSAFAMAKIAGNVPSAVLVERHGRKPYMVHSLSLIALGTSGIGMAQTFEQLYLCRLCIGLGVAALSSASTLSIADMSNPKNRAQTMAPIMSAFAAGTALGPAMGGILADQWGIHETFFIVGGCFLTMTAVNQMLLSETKKNNNNHHNHYDLFPWQLLQQQQQQQKEGKGHSMNHHHHHHGPPKTSILDATRLALGQWIPLLSNSQVRNVVIINGFYWVALAGAQMTLLPLLLTDPQGLAMTATQVGQVYMGMSLVQVLGNPMVAKLVDKFGKVPAMIGGCTLIAMGMATLPMMATTTGTTFSTEFITMDSTTTGMNRSHLGMATSLGVWSVGSTMLSTAPVAYISDVTEDETRAQAIALLRTSGDVGFLVGASAVGAFADYAGSMELAMQSSAALLCTATTWFGIRQYLLNPDQDVWTKGTSSSSTTATTKGGTTKR